MSFTFTSYTQIKIDKTVPTVNSVRKVLGTGTDIYIATGNNINSLSYSNVRRTGTLRFYFGSSDNNDSVNDGVYKLYITP
jgi:hypothetical protein